MVDGNDVVPAGIAAAGGTIRHLGMPVDPGNLLVIGAIGDTPVVGAPGCARSPKENGFDWILNRLLAGIDVTPADITALGVGGCSWRSSRGRSLGEGRRPRASRSTRRGSPRSSSRRANRGAWAGRTSSSPPSHRRRWSASPLTRPAPAGRSRSPSSPAVAPARWQAALAGLDVKLVHNPDYAQGLSTSLKAGIAALPADIEGVVVLLGDMPGVTSATIDRLIEAFRPEEGALIVVPTFAGKRGNPVLWSARFFAELRAVEGDTGGRKLIAANPDAVVEIELGSAVALDIDTPAELAAIGGVLPPH